jgi:hypothetical protein
MSEGGCKAAEVVSCLWFIVSGSLGVPVITIACFTAFTCELIARQGVRQREVRIAPEEPETTNQKQET